MELEQRFVSSLNKQQFTFSIEKGVLKLINDEHILVFKKRKQVNRATTTVDE